MSDCYLTKKLFYLLQLKPFKNDQKCFLFNLKHFFRSQRYLNFYLDFLVIEKTGLIRKIRLITNFMTSQPVSETTAIHILPNTSQSKDNQTMKFGQIIEYNKINIFLKN